MDFLEGPWIQHILSSYGYAAVFAIVMLESAGVPLPGETILVSAAVYAGSKHHLDIRYVIAAAACGAIVGDNIGFWVGREFAGSLLSRFGYLVGLDERKRKLGQYLFARHGGKIVFFGRFVALLRAFAALARMDCRPGDSSSSTRLGELSGPQPSDWGDTCLVKASIESLDPLDGDGSAWRSRLGSSFGDTTRNTRNAS